jgi:uncharacterized membrane protein
MYATFLRYSSSALIVGGATIALTLLLAGTVVRKDVYVVLQSLYAALVIISAVFMRLEVPKSRRSGALQDSLVYIIFSIGYLAFILSSGTSIVGWPVRPYTSGWWQLFAAALGAAFLGSIKRMRAESTLEKLADTKTKIERVKDISR